MRHTLIRICAAVGVLSACATASPTSSEQENTVEAEENTAAIVQAASLPAQTLEPNECGLFMWSKTDPSKFVFFNRAGETDALFLMDSKVTELTTVSFGGDIFGQFFTDVDYQTITGRNISLSYQAGEDIANGARISSGVIEYRNDEDWLTTLPVVGLRFCQPLQAGDSPVTVQPHPQ